MQLQFLGLYHLYFIARACGTCYTSFLSEIVQRLCNNNLNNVSSSGAAIHIMRLSLGILVLVLGGMAAAFEEEELEVYDVVEDVNSNFYDFLELKADCSSADIRKAYRRLSLSLHPDKEQAKSNIWKFGQNLQFVKSSERVKRVPKSTKSSKSSNEKKKRR